MQTKQSISIFNLVWSSFAKSALIPILFIELALIAAYLITNNYIRDENIKAAYKNAEAQLQEIAKLEAESISSKLDTVTQLTSLFAHSTQNAYTNQITPSKEEMDRYAFSNGAWYTTQDNGNAALFYSSISAVGEREKNKAWQLSQIDPLMKHLVNTNSLVTQAYLNTHDSMNRIYPYFAVLEQYPPDMDIPSYNFYYDADLIHNPTRQPVWTDVYIDPAGQGWMASCIAPVYRKGSDFLEGVVGLDITVTEIVQKVLKLSLSWDSYAVLLDSNGSIMAVPAAGESDWGLDRLTDYKYDKAIQEDTFRSDQYNLYKRSDTAQLAEVLKKQETGLFNISLNNKDKLASWSTINGTRWKLLVVVDEDNLYAEPRRLKNKFENIGFAMLGILIFFYLVFFVYLYNKSYRLSLRISSPLQTLGKMMIAIGRGEYIQKHTESDVTEIKLTADGLVSMGKQLETSSQALAESKKALQSLNKDLEDRVIERTSELESANNQLIIEKEAQSKLIKELHSTQRQLIQSEKMASVGQLAAGVAHEINNPLAFVNSNVTTLKDYTKSLGQLIDQQAEILNECHQTARANELQKTADYAFIKEELTDIFKDTEVGIYRIRTIIDNLRSFAHPSRNVWQKTDLNECINNTLAIANNEIKYKANITLNLTQDANIECVPSQISQVLLNVVVNAVQALETKGNISISTEPEHDGISVRITDTGKGIPKEIINKVYDPFFTTKDVGSGTGLGLSICYEIVKTHSGTIDVSSEEGKGTSFKIWLPRQQKLTE